MLGYTCMYNCIYFHCCFITIIYSWDNETKSFVLMVMCLALLPPQRVAQGLVWLCQMAKSQQATELLNNYENTRIQKLKPDQVSMFRQRTKTVNDLENILLVLQSNCQNLLYRSLDILFWVLAANCCKKSVLLGDHNNEIRMPYKTVYEIMLRKFLAPPGRIMF